jgi:hypothetical protein
LKVYGKNLLEIQKVCSANAAVESPIHGSKLMIQTGGIYRLLPRDMLALVLVLVLVLPRA